MNKVFLIGNLTRDPELRTTPSGVSVCSFTIAVNRRRANNAEAGQPEFLPRQRLAAVGGYLLQVSGQGPQGFRGRHGVCLCLYRQ